MPPGSLLVAGRMYVGTLFNDHISMEEKWAQGGSITAHHVPQQQQQQQKRQRQQRSLQLTARKNALAKLMQVCDAFPWCFLNNSNAVLCVCIGSCMPFQARCEAR
jgi:hypothetical protein